MLFQSYKDLSENKLNILKVPDGLSCLENKT